MKIKYDNVADAMYMRYSTNKISNTQIVNDAVVDFDLNGQVVWIEIIWVEKHFKDNNIILQTQEKELAYD